MVTARHHGDYRLSVRKREHGNFGTFQKFFDDDFIPRRPELLVQHDFL